MTPLHLAPNLILVLAHLLKTKSVGSTAMMLGMSQPSVSRHLAQLREAIQDPLLVRAGNQMARTPRGEELVGRLSDWVSTTASLFDTCEFTPAQIRRRFRIASTDFGVAAVCLPALPALWREAPALGFDIVPVGHMPHRSLATGDIDLALTGFDPVPEQIHHDLLFEDSFICVMRAGHPLAQADAEAVSLAGFMAYPHLALSVSDAELDRVAMQLGAEARHRKVAARVPYVALAPRMLAAGDLVMVAPARAVAGWGGAGWGGAERDGTGGGLEGLAIRRAPEALGVIRYWLLWHERSRHDPAARWLRERLIETARNDTALNALSRGPDA